MIEIPKLTLSDVLLKASKEAPDKGYTFLNQKSSVILNYGEVYPKAQGIASYLKQLGMKQSSKVLVVLEKSAEFTLLYFALLLSGVVPCILPTLSSLRDKQTAIENMATIAKQIDASWVFSTKAENFVMAGMKTVFIEDLDFSFINDFDAFSNRHAIIQASSGTTGKPKCISLSQENILSNAEQSRQRLSIDFKGNDVMVSWLPLFHDMGLIGCFLFPLYWQIDSIQMTPFQFLRRPSSWLKAISDYKGTLSTVPNFAYALAANKTDERIRTELDLSSWRSAMCGAEQIDYRTLENFASCFEASGFRREALTPCYGLAEATLCVSMHIPGTPINFENLDRKALTEMHKAILSNDKETGIKIMDCGPPVEGTVVKILNDSGKLLGEGEIGNVWIAGPSVKSNYLDKKEAPMRNYQHNFFSTGDLGYLRNGHLFITGRKKELIIIRGQNYAPTDFEWIASEIEGVANSKVVAFGFFDEPSATENLIILFEREKTEPDKSNLSLIEEVKRHIARKTGILPYRVEIVAKNFITKTTSGKVQREKVAQLFFETNKRVNS